MYKYEIIAKEIRDYLDTCKQQGKETVTLTARDVEHILNVSVRCGAKPGTRYPLVCQAMKHVPHYKFVVHDGFPEQSSTVTITYHLKKRSWF